MALKPPPASSEAVRNTMLAAEELIRGQAKCWIQYESVVAWAEITEKSAAPSRYMSILS